MVNLKTTDPKLAPYERGQQAACATESLDWNESTNEYNPYKVDTLAHTQYDQGYFEMLDTIAEDYPDI